MTEVEIEWSVGERQLWIENGAIDVLFILRINYTGKIVVFTAVFMSSSRIAGLIKQTFVMTNWKEKVIFITGK